MTVSAANRRAQRCELYPHVHRLLHEVSALRYRSTPQQMRAAAKQITFRLVAIDRRLTLQRAAQ